MSSLRTDTSMPSSSIGDCLKDSDEYNGEISHHSIHPHSHSHSTQSNPSRQSTVDTNMTISPYDGNIHQFHSPSYGSNGSEPIVSHRLGESIHQLSTSTATTSASNNHHLPPLPSSLRSAVLTLTPLTTHLFLHSAPRYDPAYQVYRQTSGLTSSDSRLVLSPSTSAAPLPASTPPDLPSYLVKPPTGPCVSLMNTPDAWHNWSHQQEEAGDEDQQDRKGDDDEGDTPSVDEENEDGEDGQDVDVVGSKSLAHLDDAHSLLGPVATESKRQSQSQSQSQSREKNPSRKVRRGANLNVTLPTRDSNGSMTGRALPDPTQIKNSDQLRPGFIQCSKCFKWRTMPKEIDVKSLPSPWQCDRNDWDERYARCTIAEESVEDSHFWLGLPIRFIRTVGGYQFYKRVVELHKSLPPSNLTNEDGSTSEMFQKFPTIRRRPVDMMLTYTTVIQLGGYDKVTASNQWKIIQSCLHLSDTHDSSITIKRVYKKYILPYEQRYWRNPRSPLILASSKPAAVRHAFVPSTHPHPLAAHATTGLKKRIRHDTVEESIGDHEDGHRKRRKNGNVTIMQAGDDSMEYGSGHDEDDLTIHLPSSASPTLVRQLRSSIDAQFRTLERRFDDRITKIESNLSRLFRESFAELRDSVTQIVHQSRKKHHSIQKELDRKQDLLAKGMNMLITERLRANLPKLAQIKLKNAAQKDAASIAHSSPYSSSLSPFPSATSSNPDGIISVTTFVPLGPIQPEANKEDPMEIDSNTTTTPTATVHQHITPARLNIDDTTSGVAVSAPLIPLSSPLSSATLTQPSGAASSTSSIAATYPTDSSITLETTLPSSSDMITIPPMIPTSASVSSLPLSAAPLASLPSHPISPRPLAWVRSRFLSSDGICFDVDSTVSAEEGIDVLAEYLGKGDQVRALTSHAMNGSMKFEDALEARLQLLQPSKQEMADCVTKHPPSFTRGFLEFVEWLRSDSIRPGGLPIYLVSGGFRLLIEPLRETLGLPEDHVFANRMKFHPSTGEYDSFDRTEFTSRSGGKAEALRHIIERDHRNSLIMIGDGITDVEACPPAQLMIGYGGITIRANVEEKAHWFVTDWKEIRELIEEKQSTPSLESTTTISNIT